MQQKPLEAKTHARLKNVGIIFSAAALLTGVSVDDANHGRIHDQLGNTINNPHHILLQTNKWLSRKETDLQNLFNPLQHLPPITPIG